MLILGEPKAQALTTKAFHIMAVTLPTMFN